MPAAAAAAVAMTHLDGQSLNISQATSVLYTKCTSRDVVVCYTCHALLAEHVNGSAGHNMDVQTDMKLHVDVVRCQSTANHFLLLP